MYQENEQPPEKSIPLTDLVSRIQNADDVEISAIIEAVVERYTLVYPDWEVMFCSLPKNDLKERKLYAKRIVAYLTETVLNTD